MGWFRNDKPTKYAQALMKVSANLFEVATTTERSDHAPLVLRFERPDSRLRYMAFCLGTTYYFSVQQETLVVLDQALRKCWEDIATFATTSEGATGFFSGPVNKSQSIHASSADIVRTIEGWKEYARHFAARKAVGQPVQRDETTARMVSTMLRHVESPASITDEDARRLEPLARWIEETSNVLESSVEQLAR